MPTTATTLPMGDSDIIAFQLRPIEEGGLRVRAYGREPTKCPLCGTSFTEETKFECPNHKFVRPKRIRVQISGVGSGRGFLQIYSDFDGAPLTFVNAGAFMAELRRRIRNGSFSPADATPVEKDRKLIRRYADFWLAELDKRKSTENNRKRLAHSTYRGYEKYLRIYVVPLLGDVSIVDVVSTVQVERWLEDLTDTQGNPASQTIQKNARDTLRAMLNFAARRGDRAPLEFRFPEFGKRRRQKLVTASPEAQEAIIQAAISINPNDEAIFRWIARKPHRTCEHRAFQVEDFALDFKRYWLRGSTDEENRVPFTKNVERTGAEFEMDDEDVSLIKMALTGREVSPGDPVFVNPGNGKAYTHRALDNKFRRARIKAGFPDITLEQFGRHSWVKQRLDEGWSFTDISHQTLNDVRTLQKFYANVTVRNRRAVVSLPRTKSRTNSGLKNGTSSEG